MTAQPGLADLHFGEAPDVSTAIPGPKSRRLIDRQAEVEANVVAYPGRVPIAVESARGATLRDVDGNTFLDFFAGMGVLNVGHSNPYVLEAVEAQLRKVAHTFDFPSEPRLELVEALERIAPGGLAGDSRVVFGGPTGSDAIEASIKLAKHVTGGSGLIAFRGAYHGATAGALSLTGGTAFKEAYAPLLADVVHLPFPHPTRTPSPEGVTNAADFCPVDGPCCDHPESALALATLAEALEDPHGGLANPAGVVVEPIQATGGIVTPPPGFLEGVAALCRRHGVPLVADEIQTGLGRTGEWFASDHHGVTPDIVPVSKSLGGVGLPLSATIYRSDYDTWGPGGHAGTFRGNVPAMAGGVRAIEYIEDQDLLARTRRMGDRLGARLRAVADRTDAIVDVRGRGLMWGLEFADAGDRAAGEVVHDVQTDAAEAGVLVWHAGRTGEVLRFMPPLVVTERQLEVGLDLVEGAIDANVGPA